MSRTSRAPMVSTPIVLLPWLLLVWSVAGCGDASDPMALSPPSPPAGPESRAPDGGAPDGGAPDGQVRGGSIDPLVDRAAEAGLDFVHFHGATGKRWMAEVMGSGVALLDYDRDGDLDVYLVQGARLAPGETLADALVPPRHPAPLSDRLYRNDLELHAEGIGTLVFTDVTEASGVAALARGYGMGVAAGDVDGDGFPDLYVTRLGENLLLHNRGDGTFEDVTVAAGAGDVRWSVPAVLFDREGDGDLDLFIGNYVAFSMDEPPDCRDSAGRPDYCGPSLYPPQGDRLLENRGDGTFRDVTAEVGMATPGAPGVASGVEAGRALGAVAEDLDGDGRRDLFVANDGMRNHLWLLQEEGTYREAALAAGLAVDGSGREEGSMGIALGDPDGDGDPDLLLTHLVTETNTLYLNDGWGQFTDASGPSGLGSPSRRHTGFGAGFFDLDGDGPLELLTLNGAVQNIEALVTAGDPFPLHETNQLFRLVGPEAGPGAVPRFEEITLRGGAVFELSEVSRGAAFGDLDNDGDTDVVVTNNGGPVRLLINRAADGARWLGLSLFTGDPPRHALGARVELLRAGEAIAWRRAAADGSYASSSDPRLLFGLGRPKEPRPQIDGLRVTWPDGTVEERAVPDVGAYVGRYTVLRQGETSTPAATGRKE